MSLIDQPLGQIARQLSGATQVFHAHALDFCCGGKQTLREAAAVKGVDPEPIALELQALQQFAETGKTDWTATTTEELIGHILTRFHERHREQLPELIRLARKVEAVHAERPQCPHGLADQLETMQGELLAHMEKEEQILFPMLTNGLGARAQGPISVMRFEHDQHGESLKHLAELTNDLKIPAAACTTWRALYLGLKTLREDLMEHIHLENNVLFENAMAGNRMQ